VAAIEVQQQSNETGPPPKKKACETCSYSDTTYLQENDDEDVAAAAQPLSLSLSLSLSPAALPLRVCVLGGVSPCSRSRLRKQQNRDNKTTKKKTLRDHQHTLQQATANEESTCPGPPLKKKTCTDRVHTVRIVSENCENK
jgi:hypothetical protein